MKVCKKCKKKVANKAKICKFCGADVTKCKIIKQPNSSVNKEEKKEEVKVVSVKPKIDTPTNSLVKEEKVSLVSKIKKIRKNRIKKERALARKAKTVKEVKRLKYKKIFKISSIIVSILLVLFLIIFGIRKLFNLSGIYVVKEGTFNNVYNMNDRIKYKDVIYSVTDVYVSQGTEYKSPKEGNCYVVVTIDFENDSKEKIRYSHKDWKMSNDSGEEKSRIFTPINVSTALYSGNLVVGGKKSGSLVFEEPISSEELLLNYYEYKEEEVSKDNNEEEEKEEIKPVFQIRIKIDKSEEDSSN